MTRRPAYVVLVALLVVALSGCISMPTSGPVAESQSDGQSSTQSAVDINPRGPGENDSPEDIVQGFLEAMQATPPITTSIAREFLTREASAEWQPSQTIVYGTASAPRGNQQVDVVLTGASRTDARGAWTGPLSAAESTISFDMTFDDGQWRIAEAPDALIVPQSWFEPRFRQVSLYFFDPSSSILIPDPVFVPRGQQLASSLVNGLLNGPAPELAQNELNYLPGQLRAVVSVPVSDAGVAQVDLTSDAAETATLPPDQAELLVSQLAWTLRQDPTIEQFRVTIGGRPVQLPDSSSEFSVEHGHEFAPYVSGSSTLLYGLRDGLVVSGEPDSLEPVSGPFGVPGYLLRTVAVDPRGEQAAAVGQDGGTLFLGPVSSSPDEKVRQVLSGGEDLLDPSFDFSGRVWTVDRRRAGSVVHYLRHGSMRDLTIPGISGADVKRFLISRDGSRLVAVVRSAEQDRIMVSRILTNGQGKVVGATAAVEVTEADAFDGAVRDIAWRSPTSIVVLHPVTRELFQVRTVPVDGAPGGLDDISFTISRDVTSLAGTPVPNETIYAVGDGALVSLTGPRANAVPVSDGFDELDYAG